MPIDGTEQVHPAPGNPHICLIHMPRRAFRFQLSFQPLVDDRRVFLRPAPNCRMVNCQTTLGHQFLDFPETERKPKIPTHTRDDDLRLKMASTEKRRLSWLHSGGAGIFYDRTGPGPIFDLLRFNGERLQRFVITNPSYPNPFAAPGASLPPTSVVRLDPNGRIPYTFQHSCGSSFNDRR